MEEKSDGGLASTFPAVHAPASSLVPYGFSIHVNRIGRRIWSLVAACTAIRSGRENAAYSALMRALLKQAPVRIQDVGLEGDRLGHSRLSKSYLGPTLLQAHSAQGRCRTTQLEYCHTAHF